MSTFIWGESNGQGKRKWRAWAKLSKPIEEGGIGMQDLGDTFRGLYT